LIFQFRQTPKQKVQTESVEPDFVCLWRGSDKT